MSETSVSPSKIITENELSEEFLIEVRNPFKDNKWEVWCAWTNRSVAEYEYSTAPLNGYPEVRVFRRFVGPTTLIEGTTPLPSSPTLLTNTADAADITDEWAVEAMYTLCDDPEWVPTLVTTNFAEAEQNIDKYLGFSDDERWAVRATHRLLGPAELLVDPFND